MTEDPIAGERGHGSFEVNIELIHYLYLTLQGMSSTNRTSVFWNSKVIHTITSTRWIVYNGQISLQKTSHLAICLNLNDCYFKASIARINLPLGFIPELTL